MILPFCNGLLRKLRELSRVVDGSLIEMLHLPATQVAVESDEVANRPAP
jgi:hypothetical protein